ncbi:MAG: hypothetical protein AAGG51_14790 [Cyanobacteria bacterium P01_G01_bin.54]
MQTRHHLPLHLLLPRLIRLHRRRRIQPLHHLRRHPICLLLIGVIRLPNRQRLALHCQTTTRALKPRSPH